MNEQIVSTQIRGLFLWVVRAIAALSLIMALVFLLLWILQPDSDTWIAFFMFGFSGVIVPWLVLGSYIEMSDQYIMIKTFYGRFKINWDEVEYIVTNDYMYAFTGKNKRVVITMYDKLSDLIWQQIRVRNIKVRKSMFVPIIQGRFLSKRLVIEGIEAHQTNNGIEFKVNGKTFEQLKQWSDAIDETVFKEQLATGRFRNWEIDQATLELMRYVEKQGKILPYYGTGGSSGVCIYHFRFESPKCHLTIEHTATGQFLELNTSGKVSWFPFAPIDGLRFKYSPLPYLVKEQLPKAWSSRSPDSLICKIVGREYQKLISWGNWNAQYALTNRYEYSFSEISIGSGFIVNIKHNETQESIDVIDY